MTTQVSLHSLDEEQLPDDWKLLPVGKLLLSSQYGTSTAISEDGNVTVIGMSELQEGEIKPSKGTKVLLSEKDKEALSLNRGDILLNRTNSYDLVGKVGIYESDEEAVFASYLVRLEVDRSKVVPEFLNFWLNSWRCQKTIKRIATRAISQANVNPTEFKKHCYVPLPPIAEQKNIVSIFSTLESLRKKTEQLISAKEKQFTALTQSLISNQCGKTKGRWPVKHLGDVFTERSEKNRGDLPLLSITRSEGIIPHGESGRKDSSNKDKAKYLRVCPGDIAYNTMRMWQGVSALSKLEGIVSPAYTVCIPSDELHGDFVAHYFKTPWMIHQFYRYSQGLTSDTWNLKFRHFREIKASIPPLEEQIQIANILNTAREEINLLKQQAERYRQQKRGLMQKLLTGEWRVSAGDEKEAVA